jgi:hypothetical protein
VRTRSVILASLALACAPESDSGDSEALPDIDALATADLVEDSIWTTTETFAPDDCAVAEGCVELAGERRLLRFSTYAPNVGEADYVVGNPTQNPERFEWGECHGHWHFTDFADYHLLDQQGEVVATGHKMAFALFDLAPWAQDAPPARYPLEDETQGISVGWVDAYVSQLDCQWIDITGLPAGDYQLEIVVGPQGVIEESNCENNVLVLPVTITDIDTGPPGVPDDWTCPEDAYGADATCDCGCGAFDPDCHNPTLDACEACNTPGSCAEAETDCGSIFPNNNAVCG